LKVSFFLAWLGACANVEPPATLMTNSQKLDRCEYRNVFVEFENPLQSSDPRVEPLRRAILSHAAEVLPRLGLQTVSDLSEAYWRLFANGWMDGQGNSLVHLGMRGELKLGSHLFVVSMADETFPYRGGIGGGYNFVTASLLDARSLDSQVETGMKWIWELDSEQILALCETRSKLIEEGWTAVDELRNELIKEMERVRRARASQQKSLEIEIEGRGESEFAE
jgi:hypothetical protein